MNFLFELPDQRRNINNCDDVNPSQFKRFTKSPLVETILRFKKLKWIFKDFDSDNIVVDSLNKRKRYDKYIIPTGVTHAPVDWCGSLDLDKDYDSHMKPRNTIFYYLSPKVLSAMRKGKAFLLMDQSHEGYHNDWLFDWFHDACEKYNIPPSAIIYVTGNLAVDTQYKEWCNLNSPKSKMCVIPHIQFDEYMWDAAKKQKKVIPTVDDHLEYKTKNKKLIKTYNCFQKRNRPHRIWMFHHLYNNNLLDDGLNSMNDFSIRDSYYEGKRIEQSQYDEYKHLLPMYPRKNLDQQLQTAFTGPLGGNFEQDLYYQEVRDSWVSVVSEASFAERTCFISEKSFKPIATQHPFIIYGNKNSLSYLRDTGYKTFDGFIDESYDKLESWDRLDAIIKEIKKIKSMSHTEKLEWFSKQRDILEYNFEILERNSTQVPTSFDTLRNYIGR